jgi:hypothetical protein
MWLDTLHAQPLKYYEGALSVVIGLEVWAATWGFARSRAETGNPLPAVNV